MHSRGTCQEARADFLATNLRPPSYSLEQAREQHEHHVHDAVPLHGLLLSFLRGATGGWPLLPQQIAETALQALLAACSRRRSVPMLVCRWRGTGARNDQPVCSGRWANQSGRSLDRAFARAAGYRAIRFDRGWLRSALPGLVLAACRAGSSGLRSGASRRPTFPGWPSAADRGGRLQLPAG
jgi:hypothetical protein